MRFVNSPEVLERFVTIEREISQIESSIQSNEHAAVTSETEGIDEDDFSKGFLYTSILYTWQNACSFVIRDLRYHKLHAFGSLLL